MAMTENGERLGYDSRAVANQIIKFAEERGQKPTLMQLIKLVYLAHGWCLATLHRPLSREHAKTWQYGPVFPLVYRAFSRFGVTPITEPAVDKATDLPFTAQFRPEELDIMQKVVEGYADMHAFKLSNLTHEADGPWDITRREKGLHSEIDDRLIQQHFSKIAA